MTIDSTISQHLAFATPRDDRVDAAFVWRSLQAQYERLRSEGGSGGSTRAALTCEFLKTLPIAVPPRTEQRWIVKSLESGIAKLDGLTAKIRTAIDRLKELRTALISAAVTGKIDVREEIV